MLGTAQSHPGMVCLYQIAVPVSLVAAFTATQSDFRQLRPSVGCCISLRVRARRRETARQVPLPGVESRDTVRWCPRGDSKAITQIGACGVAWVA